MFRWTRLKVFIYSRFKRVFRRSIKLHLTTVIRALYIDPLAILNSKRWETETDTSTFTYK